MSFVSLKGKKYCSVLMKAGYTGYTLHGSKKSHENIMAVANTVDHWSTQGRDLRLNKLRRKDKRPIAGIIT